MMNINFCTAQSRDSANGSEATMTTNSSVASLYPRQQSTAGIVTPQEPSLLLQQQQHQPLQQPPQQGCVPQTSQSYFAQQVIASMQLQQQEHQLHQQQQQHLAMLHMGYSSAPNSSHNLIPSHAQGMVTNDTPSLPNLIGTPGFPSVLIPQSSLLNPQLIQLQQQPSQSNNPSAAYASNFGFPSGIPTPIYTVQDRPMQMPIYNGVNPCYPGLRVLNSHPPMFCVDNFLTDYECDFLIAHAQDAFGPAPVVGKGAGEVSPSRTSSTCYLAREDLPDALRKVSILTGKPIEHCELPQVGRYLPLQQYLQHYDAFDMSTEDGRRFASNGGQRTITVLIYLNTVARGGATRFPALNLEVQPVRGMALVFFPSTVDGLLDQMALHAALPAVDIKYVSQIWIRQSVYTGQPSKRLPQTLGVPFGQEHVLQQQQQQQAPHAQLQQRQAQHEQGGSIASPPMNQRANFVEPW
jgi:prolyl 4-hydroxylase